MKFLNYLFFKYYHFQVKVGNEDIAPYSADSVSTSVSEVCRLQGCGAKLDKYFHFNHWF